MKNIHPSACQDHSYALPSSPTGLKARLSGALARVESLERELRNVKGRERRAKNTVHGLLRHLKRKNLMNEELKEKLDSYSGKIRPDGRLTGLPGCESPNTSARWISDIPMHLLSKQGHDYTKDQREFALTLHVHGPKVYNYLRDTLNLHLPHPHTLQRYPLISLIPFLQRPASGKWHIPFWLKVDAESGLDMIGLEWRNKQEPRDTDVRGHV